MGRFLGGWKKALNSAMDIGTAGIWGLATNNEGTLTNEIDLYGTEAAKKRNEEAKAEAEGLRRWQENLANSAHQREVEDLKAAGLNPVLSAGGSGAATPGGAMANIENEMPGGKLAAAQQMAGIASTIAGTFNIIRLKGIEFLPNFRHYASFYTNPLWIYPNYMGFII